jgi:hypothetical protein
MSHKSLVFVALKTQLRLMYVGSLITFPLVQYLSSDLYTFLPIW